MQEKKYDREAGGESEIGNRSVGEGRLRNGGEREVGDDRGVILRRKYGGGHMEKARRKGRLRDRGEREAGNRGVGEGRKGGD